MRHKVTSHSFGRDHGARKALVRGLVSSLVEHGRIRTTLPKAKELRRHVERAITMGKKGSVHARRILLEKYPNKSTVKTLVDDLAVRFKDRPGGYTRIIKAGARPGDQAPMALIEFIDYSLPEAGAFDEAVQVQKKVASARVTKKRKAVRKIQHESRRLNRK